MLAVNIILIVISLALIIYSIYSLKNTHRINIEIDNQNKELENKKNILINEIQLQKNTINDYQNTLNSLQENIKNTEKNQEELSQKAFENYFQTLENKYKKIEEDYEKYTETIETAYSDLQLKLIQEADQCRAELNKIKETRTAALKAQLKEKEIKEKQSFYCVQIKQSDLDDIKTLERIRDQLNNPRILSMLIWSTFYQKPMTALCNNVVGLNVKCGIYKITDQKTDMCYIGQSVDIASRFKQHAKCGLGIDTPAKNKLYQAMMEDGLHNFSFEILEECPKEQLNEKERYYINLYQSYEYGLNNNEGISKK
jgi:hypothetical protein